MTKKRLHKRMYALMTKAVRSDLCPLCVVQELFRAVEFITDVSYLEAKDIKEHGLEGCIAATGAPLDGEPSQCIHH